MTGRLAAAIFYGQRGLGTWVLLVSMVSASTGVFLFGGGVLGGLVTGLLDVRQVAGVPPVIVGAALGGLAGVWIGCWVGVRLTGGGGRSRLLAAATGGILGFAVAVGVASLGSRLAGGLAPLLAIVAPGVGAMLGDGLHAWRKGPGEPSPD